MSKKEIINALKYNKRLAKSYLKSQHTKEFIIETAGLIKGYEFAIILLERK